MKKLATSKVLTIPFSFHLNVNKSYIVKNEKEEKWMVEGFAGTVDLDLQGDIITEEAFKSSEQDLLNNSTVLYNHDSNLAIGVVKETKAMKEGLWVKVMISKTVPEIWKQITEGVLNKFSIRGQVLKAVNKFIEEIGKVAHVIEQMFLLECSLVPLPANTNAKAAEWYIEKAVKEFEKNGGVLDELKNGEFVVLEGEDDKGGEEAMSLFALKSEDFVTIEDLLGKLSDKIEGDELKSLIESIKEITSKKEEVKKDEDGAVSDETVVEEKKADETVVEEKKADETVVEEKKADETVVETKADEVTPANDEAAKALAKKDLEIEELKKSLKKKDDTLADIQADAKVEEKWSKMRESYNSEDEKEVKRLLKKSVLAEALTVEETEFLISKKISATQLVGITGIVTKTNDAGNKESLIKLAGIKVRDNK